MNDRKWTLNDFIDRNIRVSRFAATAGPAVGIILLLWKFGWFKRYKTLGDLPTEVAPKSSAVESDTKQVLLSNQYKPLKTYIVHIEATPTDIYIYCMHIPFISRLLGTFPSSVNLEETLKIRLAFLGLDGKYSKDSQDTRFQYIQGKILRRYVTIQFTEPVTPTSEYPSCLVWRHKIPLLSIDLGHQLLIRRWAYLRQMDKTAETTSEIVKVYQSYERTVRWQKRWDRLVYFTGTVKRFLLRK